MAHPQPSITWDVIRLILYLLKQLLAHIPDLQITESCQHLQGKFCSPLTTITTFLTSQDLHCRTESKCGSWSPLNLSAMLAPDCRGRAGCDASQTSETLGKQPPVPQCPWGLTRIRKNAACRGVKGKHSAPVSVSAPLPSQNLPRHNHSPKHSGSCCYSTTSRGVFKNTFPAVFSHGKSKELTQGDGKDDKENGKS